MDVSKKSKTNNSLFPRTQPSGVEKNSYQQVISTDTASVHIGAYKRTWWLDGLQITQVVHTAVQYPHLHSSNSNLEPGKINKRSKKRRMSTNSKEGKRFSSKMYDAAMIISWAVTIGCVAYFYHLSGTTPKQLVWSSDEIQFRLKNALFGQDQAINKIRIAVDSALASEISTFVILTGSVGVGKTTAVSIIKETFPWEANVLFYIDNGVFPAMDIKTSLKREPAWTMLIIEDCCENLIKMIDDLGSIQQHAKHIEAKLLIIMVHTTRTDKEHSFFSSIQLPKVNFYHIPFKAVSRDVVEQCFLRELNKEGLPLYQNVADEMIDSQMRFIDQVKSSPGCKLIYTKITQYKEHIRNRYGEKV